MNTPGITGEDLAIELLGAVIHGARQRAFHHVDVMAQVAQVERLGRRAGGSAPLRGATGASADGQRARTPALRARSILVSWFFMAVVTAVRSPSTRITLLSICRCRSICSSNWPKPVRDPHAGRRAAACSCRTVNCVSRSASSRCCRCFARREQLLHARGSSPRPPTARRRATVVAVRGVDRISLRSCCSSDDQRGRHSSTARRRSRVRGRPARSGQAPACIQPVLTENPSGPDAHLQVGDASARGDHAARPRRPAPTPARVLHHRAGRSTVRRLRFGFPDDGEPELGVGRRPQRQLRAHVAERAALPRRSVARRAGARRRDRASAASTSP